MSDNLNDVPLPDNAKVVEALANDDDERTVEDWNEIEEAARWALHAIGPDLQFLDVTTRNPIWQVSFRAGLLACREYMARFVEQGGDLRTAQSIRSNWWPSLGEDPGRPRLLLFSELVETVNEGESETYRGKQVTANQEALPRAFHFLIHQGSER